MMNNGNMTVDLNRSIKEITYDVSNRPVSVTFSTRPAEQRTKYLRDASGRKLRTEYQISRFASLVPGDLEHVDTSELNPGIWNHIEMGDLCPLSSPYIGGAVERWDGDEVQPADNLLWSTDFTRDYCGDIIYKDGEIERILTDNGYAVPDVRTGEYKYYYYVKDYQGNIRAVLDEENNVVESNGYYPYGMPYADNYFSVQPYKYGGKELDRTNGLDMYDLEARQYDPVLPRFTTIDPLAEKYPSISPYAYCAGNPIRFVDTDGNAVKPAGTAELIMIQNTLPKEDRKYIQLDDMGFIDKTLINSHKSESNNYNDLVQMVNDQRFVINTTLTSEYTYMDNQGRLHNSQMGYGGADSYFADLEFKNASGITTGETGKLGVTLLPGKGESGVNSVSKDVIDIYINAKLSTVGKAETFSHEGYGHTIMYLNTLDRTKSGHIIKGNRDMNIELLHRIINSRKETIKNIKQ